MTISSASKPVVWLAYVSYPVTTAVYLERALRSTCQVTTLGPKIGPQVVEAWNLQNLKLPIRDQDVPLPFEPDMAEARERLGGRDPDLYLWVESVPGYFPRNLARVNAPKACYLIDTHLNLDWHLRWATQFDHVFLAQREYVEAFRGGGHRSVHWLPLGCDPEIHAPHPGPKAWDVGFVGSIFANTRRAQLLKQIESRQLLLHVERCFWDDMARLFSASRIVFNNAIRNDLNMRVFEAMATGSFLLTDLPRNAGQEEMFVDQQDLGLYADENLIERARYFLVHEDEREAIAQRGRSLVLTAHTYAHRCAELIGVGLEGRDSTPTAAEWRERSLASVGSFRAWQPKPPARPAGRSFIVPVLSAEGEAGRAFAALLADLGEIEGELVVVFNSPEAARAFAGHPRIDLSAQLNVNVGVPRAWNLGVDMATQPTLFFLNADLRVKRSAIEDLERALWELPGAGVVGPEGSFFGAYTYEDILWFHKDYPLTSPQLVDAVSGFFFATKRELFRQKRLRFEDNFTPCFGEEWDLGLQARQAGYRSYVVPTRAYEHHWGVSSDPNREVAFYRDGRVNVRQLLAANRIRFWRKWLAITGELAVPSWQPNAPDSNSIDGPALLQSHALKYATAATATNHEAPKPRAPTA